MRILLSLLFLAASLLSLRPLQAQTVSPLHETRAVWVTTVYRLDWPPFDANASPSLLRQVQQQALDRIVERSADRGLNTIFFQVFFHGSAAYSSERVPWSNYIAGAPGRDPGWDPLEYVVEQAHARGMEVHAWFNVYQMGNPASEISETAEPLHVRVAHPDWITPYYVSGSATPRDFWIDPANPDAREWLVGNAEEIVANYDVDGIHFDYMRYAQMGFERDAHSRAQWPNSGTDINSWRRENVNMFVRDVYAAVKAIKPWVKVGSAPIGMRKYYNGAPPGFWAWDFLYQDAARWMQEGIHDYIAPQLYFDIGNNTNPHNFEYYVDEWLTHAHGRHIYAGLGTYRQNDPNEGIYASGEIGRQIVMSREKGLLGQAHFRYRHAEQAPFGGNYHMLAIPPPMEFLDAAAAPAPPSAVDVQQNGTSYSVAWAAEEAAETDPLRRFAIFRNIDGNPDTTSSGHLVAVVGPQARAFEETLDLAEDAHPYYRVVAQSLLGMTASSEVVTTDPSPVNAEHGGTPVAAGIEALYPNPSSSSTTLSFAAPAPGTVRIRVVDMMGRIAHEQEVAVGSGTNQLRIDVGGFASGLYVVQTEFRGSRSSTRLIVVH